MPDEARIYRVCEETVAQLYRERDEYVLKYLPGTDAGDFVSLTMPVREEPGAGRAICTRFSAEPARRLLAPASSGRSSAAGSMAPTCRAGGSRWQRYRPRHRDAEGGKPGLSMEALQIDTRC